MRKFLKIILTILLILYLLKLLTYCSTVSVVSEEIKADIIDDHNGYWTVLVEYPDGKQVALPLKKCNIDTVRVLCIYTECGDTSVAVFQ